MLRFSYFVLVVIIGVNINILQGQTLKPKTLIKSIDSYTSVDLFSLDNSRSVSIPADIEDYTVLALNNASISSLLQSRIAGVSLSILQDSGEKINLKLGLVDIQPEGSYVISQPSGELVKVNPGKHYRGIVAGDESSLVSFSIYEDEVMGLILSDDLGNLVIGKLEDSESHIIYNDKNLKPLTEFECGARDGTVTYSAHDLKAVVNQERALSDCVKMYLEVDFDIFQDKGGMTGTTNYITGLYNQVATMYANENINTVLQPLVIWSQTSPYSSGNSGGMLDQFTAQHNGFDGDLAMLLSYQASGGIAYVDGLCSGNPDYSMGFSSIASTYNNVPTYSWSVMVMTHEFGHIFGSQHTHACAWNGNNTAIDGCYTTEGGCGNPGLPAGGGTVMSYCHLTSVGINLNLGFGTQPGNLIRNRVANASCTTACDGGGGPTCTDGIQNGQETGVDCGGPDCPPCDTGGGCTQNEATLTLVLDNYPGETTWTVTDAAGTTLYSGGPYSSVGATVTEIFCIADGCFDYNIFDSYGDGICCSYGSGSYDISDASGSLASGGAFTSSESKNFCVNGGVTPTCTDGIQNGDETGVDCGGPDCPSCPSCTDGIMNGDETGVDCGGPDCPVCPSCTDGIQNGNETGIDCGGPDCPSCPTCTDGIQNGNETGIDCGGPDCPSCPSCTDGIQNGQETGVDCGGPDCVPCDTGGGSDCSENEVILNLQLDNYPGETTWNITNSSNNVLHSGGPYTSAGSTVSDTFCLPDGCYDFNIFDTYGDGICCSYGQGFYEVNGTSGSLASGGEFGSSETKNFCVGGGDETPTCTDGIQNGDETGVDCGGPDCPSCPTCTDGIQNGDETGVDCGGTLCPSCPSCTDGIQNGDETGVDCGGPDCPSCPTCDDGIQNGDETGVDCGGPDCEDCDTGGGGGSEVVFAHYFENGWDGWQDGGSDCYRYSGTRAYEGNFAIRLRDNSGTSSAMTSASLNLSAYSGLELSFYFYPNSMEANEDFWLRYYDGSQWHTVATFTRGTDFNNNQFYVVTVPISGNDYNMATNAKFRLQCDASSNADRIYIDAVTLTGLGAGNLLGNEYKISPVSGHRLEIITSEEDLLLSPNPASSRIKVSVVSEVEYMSQLTITDIMGRVIQRMNPSINVGNNTFDLGIKNLANGTYFIKILDEEGEYLIKRFIKI